MDGSAPQELNIYSRGWFTRTVFCPSNMLASRSDRFPISGIPNGYPQIYYLALWPDNFRIHRLGPRKAKYKIISHHRHNENIQFVNQRLMFNIQMHDCQREIRSCQSLSRVNTILLYQIIKHEIVIFQLSHTKIIPSPQDTKWQCLPDLMAVQVTDAVWVWWTSWKHHNWDELKCSAFLHVHHNRSVYELF